ncbi:MAG: 50S ribosomal protein L29 [Candidatus Methylomirabilales bacterium]
MTVRELRELAEGELAEKARAFREELFKLRLRASVSQLENPMRIRDLRRDLARIATVLRERLRGAVPTEGGKA